MVGTKLTRAGTRIIGRNQYYSCLAFRLEQLIARNEYYATGCIIHKFGAYFSPFPKYVISFDTLFVILKKYFK
jgi:hypothetical protein